MIKTYLIYNPKSGKQNFTSHLDYVMKRLKETGHDVIPYETKYMGHATKLAKQACENLAEMIVIVGGDGTFNECVNGLMDFDKKPIIGYIPAGTCCDIGHTLGLSKTVSKAVENIINNKPVYMDIVKSNDRYFCYVSGNGAFIDISYVTDSRLKRKIGYLAYVIKGVEELLTIPKMRMKVIHDNGEFRGKFSLVLIINSKRVAGINMIYKPRLDDGLVDIVLYRNIYPLNWLLYFTSFLLPFWSTPLVKRFKTSSIKIVTNTRSRWNIDGESGGIGNQDIKVFKQAISIIIPAKSKLKYFKNQEDEASHV
ncbi:MAG: diacylglycerol kinase family lipid kinase [Candidatus Izemoplasmatales bacterium]|nr:diacylglycerol kinase family lipid kinase [Candidatus Izemoplasmatales bacterium]